MSDRNDRVRESAYFLWLEEGRPEDAAERHWLAAEGLIDDEPLEDEPAGSKIRDEPKKRSPSTTEKADRNDRDRF
jgi:hypothetical protein